MIVENAKMEDIDLLTELRLAYLEEDHGKLSETDIEKIRQDLPDYFKRNLNKNIFCYLIRDKDDNEQTSIRCSRKKFKCCRTEINRRRISSI